MASTSGDRWRFVPFLDRLPPDRADHGVWFGEWWTGEVLPDVGYGSVSRRDFVLKTANSEGGAHVDPAVDETLAVLQRQGVQHPSFTFDTPVQEMGNGALASVRQIAWEALETFRIEIADLVDPSVLGPDRPLPRLHRREAQRNESCPCGSGRKFKRCHGT